MELKRTTSKSTNVLRSPEALVKAAQPPHDCTHLTNVTGHREEEEISMYHLRTIQNPESVL